MSWNISFTKPGTPFSGVAQNGQTAWNPLVPWGISTFAQYLKGKKFAERKNFIKNSSKKKRPEKNKIFWHSSYLTLRSFRLPCVRRDWKRKWVGRNQHRKPARFPCKASPPDPVLSTSDNGEPRKLYPVPNRDVLSKKFPRINKIKSVLIKVICFGGAAGLFGGSNRLKIKAKLTLDVTAIKIDVWLVYVLAESHLTGNN